MYNFRTPTIRPAGRLGTVTALLVASLLGWAAPAAAQLRLDITQGVRDAVPIAVVPFAGQSRRRAGRHSRRHRQ
jgi:hypothetical protein